MATAGEAATAGGVTTIVALPSTDPVLDHAEMISHVIGRARDTARVRVYPYGALTKGRAGLEITEMGLMAEAGAVAFTDGDRAVGSALVMRRALSYARAFDLLIVQHPDEPALAAGGAMNEGEVATRLGLAGIPAAAEVMMVERDLRLVALTGARYHAAHLSTAASIEAIRQAKRQGLRVTCDTAPPYFTLTEAAVGNYRTFAKLSPPLRAEADRAAVVQGLADGTIDAIASDHIPQDQDSKRLPFASAEPGILGLETLLSLTLELVHARHLSLAAAIALLSPRPARLLGLAAGRLAPGAPADFILVDADASRRIDVDGFRSKTRNSPFDGRQTRGRVLRTVVGGETVFSAAAVEPAHG
jgi:dihydroorotase